MAVKSVIEIDLQGDEKFRAFSVLYEKYQTALAKAPGLWAQQGKEIQAQRHGFEAIAAAMLAQFELATKTANEAKRNRQEVDQTATGWRRMARDTATVAANIKDTTLNVIRWVGLASIAAGLLGGGGLFGLERLGLSASSGRRTALGLGVSYGALRSFGSNFGRLVDPDSFLGSVAGAQFDVTKRVGLLGAGLTNAQINGPADQTSVALLQQLKRIADTTNPALYGQVLAARQLGQFASPQDLERLRNTSQGEFNSLINSYAKNRKDFDLPDDAARKWQEFTTQMDRAGRGIETTFIRGLAPLAPGLEKLSAGFEKVVQTFLESDTLKKWIEELSKGIESFATYVGTPDFQTKVQNFVLGVAKLAEAIGGFVSWAAGFLPGGASSGPTAPAFPGQGWGYHWGDKAAATSNLGAPPANLLGIVRRLEGSPDNFVNPNGGAIGRYQIKPGTASDYGYDPSRLLDGDYNEKAAKGILASLIRRYHGNTNEVLAAYNQGDAGSAAYRAHGDNPAFLKPEGQKYIDRAQHMQGYTPVVVTVDNSTGGNVAISTNSIKGPR